jgi:hypothetical protein
MLAVRAWGVCIQTGVPFQASRRSLSLRVVSRYYESRTRKPKRCCHWLPVGAVHPPICTFGRIGLDGGLETRQTLVL